MTSFRRLLILALPAALLISPTVHGQTLTTVGAYAGGENDANFANGNQVDSGFDSSGNGQHLGPAYGNSYWSTTTSPGAANFLNGVGSPSTRSYYFTGADRLAIASPLTTATSNWGMEAWAKSNYQFPTQTIMLNGSGGDGYGIMSYNGLWNGLIGGIEFIPGAPVVIGAWTHLALINDGGTTTFYVNGVSYGTSDSTPVTPTTNFSIGGDLTGTNFVDGYIDQVRFFTFTGTFNTSAFNLSAAAIPEPSTYAMIFGAGALGLAAWRRRARRETVRVG